VCKEYFFYLYLILYKKFNSSTFMIRISVFISYIYIYIYKRNSMLTQIVNPNDNLNHLSHLPISKWLKIILIVNLILILIRGFYKFFKSDIFFFYIRVLQLLFSISPLIMLCLIKINSHPHIICHIRSHATLNIY
jgi:hypothetical protein